MDIRERYAALAAETEKELDRLLPPDGSVLCEAMRYSLLGGGKRLRGVLVLSAFELCCGKDRADARKAAAAIEMMHASSLIHDDLPCMDDDDLRRGKPSCHRAFGEAMAVLAGDALLNESFRCLSLLEDHAALVACVGELSAAAGRQGMMLGQELDLTVPEKERDASGLDRINRLKTGMLIRAAVRMGFHCSGNGNERTLRLLDVYSDSLGRAFQISDDVLDVTGTEQQLGKPAGSDAKNGTATYASVYGLEGARQEILRLEETALNALSELEGDTSLLEYVIRGMTGRKN